MTLNEYILSQGFNPATLSIADRQTMAATWIAGNAAPDKPYSAGTAVSDYVSGGPTKYWFGFPLNTQSILNGAQLLAEKVGGALNVSWKIAAVGLAGVTGLVAYALYRRISGR